MSKAFGSFAVLALVVGCAEDDVDPVGSWVVTMVTEPGRMEPCTTAMDFTTTLEVTAGPRVSMVASPDLEASGQIERCGEHRCLMIVSIHDGIQFSSPGWRAWGWTLVLEPDGAIEGGGQVSGEAADGSICVATQTVTGSKQ